MFQFRFLDDDTNTDTKTSTNTCQWKEAKEILPSTDFVTTLNSSCTNTLKCDENIYIKYITSSITELLPDRVKDSPIFTAEENYSDLLTGIYEGGFKIWECTYDLANYLVQEQINFNNKKVLDLGCGSGIIGILALIKESNVCFQDYNEEIVRYITIPNAYLNNEASKIPKVCRFYSGDWNSFLSITEADYQLDDDKFDYIFTSETIYNPDNYGKLHAVFKQRLKRSGIIYLAAKTHYFGVGGGLRQFEDVLIKNNIFDFFVCWKCSEGLRREILKITFKK